MAIQKWDDQQLEFDLGLDDVSDDASERSITPGEAQVISETARQLFLDSFKGLTGRARPEWFADYELLISHGWPWRVACYIAWASSPKTDRWPKTLAELATQVLGLTGPRTIHAWRKKHPTLDDAVSMMQSAPLWQHRRDVLDALAEMAKKKDYKAHNDRELFLKMTGDYDPKLGLELGKSAGSALSGKTDDELEKWAGVDAHDGDGDEQAKPDDQTG